MSGADEFPGTSATGLTPGDAVPGANGGSGDLPVRRRTRGVLLVAVADLLLAALSVYALRSVASAEQYALSTSPEIGAELEAALAGFAVMRIALYLLAAGFAVSAVAAFSLSRLGFAVHVTWAVLVCFTLVGLPYGLPVLVFLMRRSTRERFGRVGPDADRNGHGPGRGRLLEID